MSSNIQSTLQLVFLNSYLTLAGITAVVYDYTLTFSRELDYVWCRSWTWVSTMFVVARYIGLCWIMTSALVGTSFVPGPLEVGQVMYLASIWAYIVFLSTADLVMILRVYAMWNRSRTILCVLLLLYIIQTIFTVVSDGMYNNPKTYLSVKTIRVLDFSHCSAELRSTSSSPAVYYLTPRLVLSAVLIILAVFQTLRESFEMYKATKQWQPNRYMQKLVKDGIIYFIVNVLYQTNDLLSMTGFRTGTTAFMLLQTSIYVYFYILIPRFIISIRELYDRDTRGHFHIDTGFGMQSQLNAGSDTTMSAMVFVDVNQGPEVEGGLDNSGDVGVGRVHGSNMNEESSIGARV